MQIYEPKILGNTLLTTQSTFYLIAKETNKSKYNIDQESFKKVVLSSYKFLPLYCYLYYVYTIFA